MSDRMKKVVFMGTPDFTVPVLEKLITSEYDVVLVVTQPDRPKGRKKRRTPPPVKIAAERAGIPVFQPEKLSETYEQIVELQPDLIVTAAYGQLLPDAVLDSPKYGCINVHASLLPELRGGAPIHHAILEGKKETGITIMFMVKKLDAGDILSQATIQIEDDDHVGTLHDKLSDVGAHLLMDTMPKLFAGEMTPEKQDEQKATYAPNIKRSQEKIDWTEDNTTVYNHIRGLHPWPVAYTTYEGQSLKIWWGTADMKYYDGEPGEIVDIIEKESCIVLCGNNRGIHITEIQPAGKRRMTVAQYLLGDPDRLKLGMVLGE